MKIEHRWVNDKCEKCNLTREFSSQYGRRIYVYRNIVGDIVKIGKLPPCTFVDTEDDLKKDYRSANRELNNIEFKLKEIQELKNKLNKRRDELIRKIMSLSRKLST